MELHRLSLENFRQFRDESIEFAREANEGVTVIHGSNGAGKTTLLNAFTWLFYNDVDFDTRPDRLVTEGAIAEAGVGDRLTVSVVLEFEHDNVSYVAERQAVYEKQSATDFDGEMVDMDLTVKSKDGETWNERGNPRNTLDQIIPERLSSLFFFDGEDIEELAGIDNQDRIQESIQNIMGLTILERATRHLDTVSGRFEDEVEEYASDELAGLIEKKRKLEGELEALEREHKDKKRARERIKTEIRDIDQKLERLDESAALQERREEYETQRQALKEQVEDINEAIRNEVDGKGFVPLAMPLLEDTAEQLDEMRKDGVIPSDLSNSYIDSLLEAEQCICGRSLESGTKHRRQIESMKGEGVADGVEQSAIRIIGHLNQIEELESEFFENVDDFIAERKELHDEIIEKEELIDEVSSELQDMDQTTESGESIKDLEKMRESKQQERDQLANELGRVEERIEQKEEAIAELEERIDAQRDEQEEALIAKRRQRAAELVSDELDEAFAGLKNKVRELSNSKINETFGSIASKDMTAEVTEDFKLKIWQDVGGERIEVDKSTGERQIASLAFVGSLVDIARQRYESDADSEYFTGGIYPLVMDSPFGALDKSHRRQVSRVIPKLANQVVVFATDSQWEGPVEDEMKTRVGQQYWLDFDEGNGTGEYPQTRIRSERVTAGGTRS
ncbi:AAA family ATPase [Haloarchaeobius amylolyticus]|uniref:AAA family ATPase n=1 Tax=Haloarchaeobius amylolyticus TaxID=1198296 RepID=UPI002270D7D9|nr:AAA family ATPase [Haloarchaeobius amylolyticus]